MRKLGLFMIFGIIITFILQWIKVAILCIVILLTLFIIHKMIIKSFPRLNSNLKWGGKL